MPPDPADLVNTILAATPHREEAHHAAARAALAVLLAEGDDAEERLFEWHQCASCPTSGPCACAGVPYPSAALRAAIDAALGDPRPVAARQAAAALRWAATNGYDDEHIDTMGRNWLLRLADQLDTQETP